MSLMILMSFCSTFIKIYVFRNYSNKGKVHEVIAKIKWCSFFASHIHARANENNSRFALNRSELHYLVLRSSDITGSSATDDGRLDGKTALIRCSPI